MNFIMVAERTPRESRGAQPPVQGRRVRQISEMLAALSTTGSVAVEAAPCNRRWAPRKRTETPAYIGHAKNPHGVRCIVRDTSSSGALVEVCAGSDSSGNPADEIPEKLTLVFVSYKERSEVACVVMRRSGRMLGVRYVGPFRSFAAPVAAKSGLSVHFKKKR